MKILSLTLLLLLTSCGGDYTHEFDDIEAKGETTSTFGPDFEAWLAYCEGKVDFEAKTTPMTEQERQYNIEDCYYNLDLNLPVLPEEGE